MSLCNCRETLQGHRRSAMVCIDGYILAFYSLCENVQRARM